MTSLLHYWRRRSPTSAKAVAGISMLCALLVFFGMTLQSWREASERQAILAECERRVGAVREQYKEQSDERSNIVYHVKRLADETLERQKATLELLERRGPMQERLERKVDALDDKATAAATAAKGARAEAARAAEAAEIRARQSPAAGAINESIRAVNRLPK